MKIGVISDTHTRFISDMPRDIILALSSMDLIVHAGDITHNDVLNGLRETGEVIAVCGNMDTGTLRDMLPQTEMLSIHGKKIGIIHGWGSPWGLEEKLMEKFPDADVIIYGHTHQPKNEYINGVLFFNPGPGSKSFGILTVTEDSVEGRIIHI